MLRLSVVFILISGLGCSSIPTLEPIAPNISVESVDRIGIEGSTQVIEFQLALENQNRYGLDIDSISFITSINGVEFAKGQTTELVTLPALASVVIPVKVKARMQDLLGPLLSFIGKPSPHNQHYRIEGSVKLSNWPITLPFTVEGNLLKSDENANLY